MSTLRIAPTGVFELHRNSPLQHSQPPVLRYASERDTEGVRNGEVSRPETKYEVEEVDECVREDMNKLEDTFPGISDRFRLVNRIGEGRSPSPSFVSVDQAKNSVLFPAGTFSTVYKAEDLLYDHYHNDWDAFGEAHRDEPWATPPAKRRRMDEDSTKPKTARYVALKKIYVTSSPIRIQNELELLHNLRGCKSVCPLITAFRFQDQVVAVLPYFPHSDFRVQYRTFMVADMRHYLRSLLTALHSVHQHGILHRDIKPTLVSSIFS